MSAILSRPQSFREMGSWWIHVIYSPMFVEGASKTLQWRHNEVDNVSNYQPHGCSLNRLFRRRSKKTSKLRVTGLCVGNSPGPVNSPHKGPVTRKMFPFDDVIMYTWMIGIKRHVPNHNKARRSATLVHNFWDIIYSTCVADVTHHSIKIQWQIWLRNMQDLIYEI